MRFDVIQFLDNNSIAYKSRGTNIAENWVGIEFCPFCNDRRYHFGMNLLSGGYSCWVCGAKGWVYEFIAAYYGISLQEVRKIGKEYLTDTLATPITRRRNKLDISKKLLTPSTFSSELPAAWLAYLEKRNFDISIAARYNLMSAGIIDREWKYRLIIPFYIDGQLVSWTGRDITDQMPAKYKNCPNDLALIDTRQTIYNIDAMSRKSILTEGATDVHRLGGATGAIIGLNMTTAQMLMIKNKGVEELTIVFDGEPLAQKRAREVAKKLEFIGITTHVIDLGNGLDPGMLSDEEAFALRREVFKLKI